MALIRCDFFSEVLEVGTSMTVLLPQAGEEQIGVSTGPTARPTAAEDGFPVLYLLHGLSDDGTAWLRYTSIERYAAALGLAVVMPQVQRTFYADEAHGERYLTFLSEELPGIVASFFRVSGRREDTFVAGLSMGGYGALKWALHQPERFAAAASLSGALDLEAISQDEWRKPRIAAGVRRPGRPRATTCSRCSTPPTSTRCRRSTSGAAPRTSCTTATCGSSTRRWPPGSTYRWTSGPASTSGGSGTRPSSDVLAWLPLGR